MGNSIYDRLIVLYSRTHQGRLIRCFGGDLHSVKSVLSAIKQKASTRNSDSYHCFVNISIDSSSPSSQLVDIHELDLPDSSTVVGIALRPTSAGSSILNFEQGFCHLLLERIGQISKALEGKELIKDVSITEKVVDLLNDELLFHTSNSQWGTMGRDYLLEKISFFTSRGMTIEMCLPAFPCKSSNLDKVAGTLPDRGEELALRRLYEVLRKVKLVYKAGARICIISDGHVFSDCSELDPLIIQ